MKSIFEENAYNEIKNRLENLSENANANWGKMSVEQMLEHYTKPIELALGESEIK
jgi:tetrahydromethanopterin S-methyltransferase subunit G